MARKYPTKPKAAIMPLVLLAVILLAVPKAFAQLQDHESKGDWDFRAACLGKWARSDLVAALDTAKTRQPLVRFSHGIHYFRMGPFTRCPYEVSVGQGMQCAEIDTGSYGDPVPYLVRWDSASGKGVIIHEAWDMVSVRRSKSVQERHVGPDSVGWLRPGNASGKPFVDVVFRKDSVRMVPGENFEQLVNQRFLSGIWMPLGVDSASVYTIYSGGHLRGFRLSALFAMSPEQKADSNNYGGHTYDLLSDHRNGERMVVKNVWVTPVCTLSWKRRQDTLRLSIFQKSVKRSKSAPWCDFVRIGDAPATASEMEEVAQERLRFDSLRQAAFLPADIRLDPVIRCLLESEAHRIGTTDSWAETPAQTAAGRATCLASDTGEARLTESAIDTDGVVWIRARDSSWSMEQSWLGEAVLSASYHFPGPPFFRYMAWERRDAAFREAFRFLEPTRGPRWIPMHEDARYSFDSKSRSCFIHGEFANGISLKSSCAHYGLPNARRQGKGARK
jgi:hypothetical protein